MNYHIWTPDSGTTEIATRFRGVPVADMETAEVEWWRPKPEVMATARYERAPLFPRLRKFVTVVGVVFGCLALSAVPSPTLDMPSVELVQR